MSSFRGHRNEHGAVAAEVVIITPLLLLMLMMIIQFAMWEHAGHIAQAAAIEGARSARLEGGTSASGQTEAAGFLAQLGSKTVTSPSVVVARSATTATVTVTGYAEEVVPGMHLPVKATSSGPLETLQ